MDILIVENVWMGSSKYSFFDKTILTAFSILPTLYARQIAAITPKEYNVHVLNERYEKINFNKNYNIVNITFTTSTSPRAYEIADEFRKRNVKVVLSGMHASAVPKEAIQHADSILLGRGELEWLDFLKDFKDDKIKQFYQPKKYDGSIKIPPSNIKLPGFVITSAIEATRGCPYKCEFCPETNISNGISYYERPIVDVIEELKSIPQKIVMFYDSSLTINPKYTKELFREMKKLKKRFFCNGNVDTLSKDEELVRLSKEAGCLAWLIGFESVSQETLDSIDKKTNKIQYYKKAVENIHRNKMAVIGCFIFGFDNDKKTVFEKTIGMIKELNIDVADFCALTPFPGTPIYSKFQKESRIITSDWSKYNLKSVVFKPKNMTMGDLQNGLTKMYLDFYSYSYTIKRILNSFRYGFVPFFSVLGRNIVAVMNSKKL